MPLSFLTRLRGILAATILAAGLLSLDIVQEAWISPMIFAVTTFLMWMLASNAVKEAPPFDDTAFHRTRPRTSGQVFRHLAGFHLLLLAGILAFLTAYGCYFNVGLQDLTIGALIVSISWIALVSLFATVASLATSTIRWKGWGALVGLLVPALSTFAMIVVAVRNSSRGTSNPDALPSYLGMCLVAALLYPLLWWLVSAKRAWGLGCALALLIGASLPWASRPLRVGEWVAPKTGYFTQHLDMQRPANPVVGDIDTNQTAVSRLIEVKGLAPDEFIAGLHLWKRLEHPYPGSDTRMDSDNVLSEINGTTFTADSAGRMIPAPTSLVRAMGLELENDAPLPVWTSWLDHQASQSLHTALGILTRSYHDYNPSRNAVSPETSRLVWEFSGARYQWVKALEVDGAKGGRAKLPGGGIIEIIPPEASSEYPELVVRIIKGRTAILPGVYPLPALIAQTADGKTGVLGLSHSTDYFPFDSGFLIRRTILKCNMGRALKPQELVDLKGTRLIIYWPAYRGSFHFMLPPPE